MRLALNTKQLAKHLFPLLSIASYLLHPSTPSPSAGRVEPVKTGVDAGVRLGLGKQEEVRGTVTPHGAMPWDHYTSFAPLPTSRLIGVLADAMLAS